MSFHQIPQESGYNPYPVYPQHVHQHPRGGGGGGGRVETEGEINLNEHTTRSPHMSPMSPSRKSRGSRQSQPVGVGMHDSYGSFERERGGDGGIIHDSFERGSVGGGSGLRRSQQPSNFAAAIENLAVSPEQNSRGRHSHHVNGSFSPKVDRKRPSDFVAAIPVDMGSLQNSNDIPRMPSLYKMKSPDLLQEQRQDLGNHGFPNGLTAELGKTRSFYPVRFWILDNSGSMMANDGCSIRGSTSVQCTRWAELQETVSYHAQLAGVLQATSIFRLLNDPGVRVGPQEFSIADSGKNYHKEIQDIKKIMQLAKPHGSTPLTQHLVEIAQRIAVTEDRMRKKGLEAVVIIATDGLPTSPEGHTSEALNDEFILALQHLQTLPVWVVIRLCTDEEEVVNFYNKLDQVLELPIEVLDDFFAEAKEIQRYNKWLNYAMPLHRCREIGYQHRIFDMLDERPLNKDELKEFCESVFGGEYFASAPDIHDDFIGFIALLNKILKNEKLQFNPVTKKMQPWIDTKELKRHFSNGGIAGMIKKRISLTKKK